MVTRSQEWILPGPPLATFGWGLSYGSLFRGPVGMTQVHVLAPPHRPGPQQTPVTQSHKGTTVDAESCPLIPVLREENPKRKPPVLVLILPVLLTNFSTVSERSEVMQHLQ